MRKPIDPSVKPSPDVVTRIEKLYKEELENIKRRETAKTNEGHALVRFKVRNDAGAYYQKYILGEWDKATLDRNYELVRKQFNRTVGEFMVNSLIAHAEELSYDLICDELKLPKPARSMRKP